MKIGLVLSNTPSKSETFFNSKIMGLQESGYEVVLFANQGEKFNFCRMVPHPKVNSLIFIKLAKMMVAYGILFITCPIIFFRFLHLEKKDGVSIRIRWENLYLISHILKEKLDWLHFGFATMSIRRENVACTIGAKMGVSIRGYDICIYPLKHPGCYQRLWDKVNKVHSISSDLLIAAHKQGLTDRTPQVTIHPAINVDHFNLKGKNWETLSNTEIIHFLTVARLHWKKGLDYILQALSIIKEKNIPFHYTIVGEGQELERLIFSTHQLGLDGRVTFAGAIPHKNILKYYKDAGIYLQYSIQEGFCNAVLEAQVIGLPTIVSNAEGLPENVLHDSTGWVVPKRSPKLLAKKIEHVITIEDKKLIQILKNGRTRIKNHFSLEKQFQDFGNFFSKIHSFPSNDSNIDASK